MSYDKTENYDINPVQIAKIMGRLDDNQADAFRQAVASYNELTGFDQFAGDAINGGVGSYRVDISVDPRRPVIHVEIDALRSGLFFRCEIGGDIVIQELAL
jgi:hypothetical protein